jgi:2-polyprenyl-3-methyl-5-hydroxy-6-metoxy-1,4-benzoquinol methylase
MAESTTARDHWQNVYGRREPDRVSWFEPVPRTSLDWIARADLPLDAAILDAGGGASTLAGELTARGYADVTVADISTAALERARAELGPDAEQIAWLAADLRTHTFDRSYDLWHDRAVFHFMVDDADRDAYLTTLRTAISPGGHLMLATFGPNGPTQCSNLPVRRYSATDLATLLDDAFELEDSQLVDHPTPSGSTQQFVYAHLRRLS